MTIEEPVFIKNNTVKLNIKIIKIIVIIVIRMIIVMIIIIIIIIIMLKIIIITMIIIIIPLSWMQLEFLNNSIMVYGKEATSVIQHS